MQSSVYPRSFWARCLIAVLFPLMALSVQNLLMAPSRGQDPPPKHSKEEEVEDPGAGKHPGKTLRVPDNPAPQEKTDDQAPGKTAGEAFDQPESNGPASLALDAQKATDPAVKKLYETLSHPFDRWRQRRVVPIPKFIGDSPSFAGTIEITPYREGPGWRRASVRKLHAREMGSVLPFEQIALDEVSTFLRPELPGDASDADRSQYIHKLDGAARVLDAVLSWHLSAKNDGERVGDDWSKIERQLRDRLRDVLLKKFRLIVGLKHFEDAYSLGMRLTEQYPKDKDVQAAFADFMVEQAQASAKRAAQTQNLADWRVVAEQWRVLQRQYPQSDQVKNLGDQLAGVAKSRKDQADALRAKGDNAKALQLLRDAYILWPNLAGLQEEYLGLSGQYPILYVGVPQLPQYFSPATAVTDTERQAVELMFDSLIEPTPVGAREPYRLSLARDMPRMIPLGRQFTLRNGLRWAQYGKPVTYHKVDASNLRAVDVRQTVELMHQSGQAGMLRGVELSGANNNLELNLTLTQGYIDPLALMTFKIVPWWLHKLDDPGFAQHPVSSGPFVFKSRSATEVVFAANPLYQYREGMEGLPAIQEIHFFVSADHAGDFTDLAGGGSHKMDLLLGLSTADVKQLGSTGVIVRPMRNRRICFLAVNHRRAALENLAVREVIANAIDREGILNAYFRDPNSTIQYHRPLLGAYPPESWAYTKVDDFNRKTALAKAAGIDGPVKLTLLYPDGNPDAESACQAIAEAMPKDKIQLVPQAVEEHELRNKVEGSHDYDLAYYHWDFPTESYSLWPLFDAAATGANGTNYLGSSDDTAELVDRLQRLNTSRNIKNVKNEAALIQGLVHAKLPFIPLWQLDTFIAYHKGLNLGRVPVDPICVFNDAAHWDLRKQ